MTKKPNLKTLAQAAGVSVPTASQVMRGTGRISEETRKKVLKAAERLHYVPDGRAASMRSGEKREIGMLIHRISNPFNATRYHSLVIERPSLPNCLNITAWTEEDNDIEIMGIEHKEYPTYGLQFHPESILTTSGHQLLKNFLEI